MKTTGTIIIFAAILVASCSQSESEVASENSSGDGTTISTDTSEINSGNVVVEDELENNCTVSVDAYIADPDASGPTNVRSSPNGKVVLELIHDGEEYEEYFLSLVGSQDGWFKVEDKIDGIVNAYSIPGGLGWIHGSVIGVDTRNYGGETLDFYESADENSKVVATIKSEKHFKLKDSCGDWTQVEGSDEKGKKFVGWIKNEWLCGNPLTTCS